MRLPKIVAWTVGALSIATFGVAQLEVDSAGGPLTLSEQVAEAFDVWQRSFPEEVLTEPTARIAFDADLVGPDTSSLTLRYDDGRTEVLLSPTQLGSGPVLLHEIGVLLGLSPTGEGVMDPSFDEATPGAPTDADLAMLRELRAFPAADLTRDGVVDFYDLAALAAAFNSVGFNLRGDLDGDGRVDESDLAILRDAYAFSGPARTAPSARNLAPFEALNATERDGAAAPSEPARSPEAPAESGSSTESAEDEATENGADDREMDGSDSENDSMNEPVNETVNDMRGEP